MRSFVRGVIAVLLVVATNVLAKGETAQRPREFDIATTIKLARAMFEQAQQIHQAGYLMHKYVASAVWHDAVPLIGYFGDGNRVRFARATASGPEVFFEVDFRSHSAPAGFPPTDHSLTPEEVVQFKARQLVLTEIANRCVQTYETLVLKDPENDGWLVWALGVSDDPDLAVLGVHYRFMVSADGQTDLRHDVLAPVCGTQPVGQTPRMRLSDITTVETIATHPTELHVLESFTRNVPVYVATAVNRKLWVVQPFGAIMFFRDIAPNE